MKSSNFPRQFTSAPNARPLDDDEEGFPDEQLPLDSFEDLEEEEPGTGDTTKFEFEPRLPALPEDTGNDTGIAFDTASLLLETNNLESTPDDELVELKMETGLLLSGLGPNEKIDEQELVMGALLEDFSLTAFDATADETNLLRFQDIDIDYRFTLHSEESSPWHEERLFHDRSLTSVDCSNVAWVTGGPDLVWLPEQGHNQIRCSVEGGKIAQLCLCHDTAVYVTDRGFLGRRHARASQPELLGRLPGTGSAARAKLGKYQHSGIEHLWLLVDGALWLSQDLGATWKLHPTVLKGLDACSYALELRSLGWVKDTLYLNTVRLDSSAPEDALLPLKDAPRFARASEPRIQALLNLVVVWDKGLGVFTSSDGRALFSPCPRLQTPTAAVAGLLDERPAVWVACHDSGIDESLIWQITADAPTGKCIARIQDPTQVSDELNGEFPRNRIRGLAWDEGLTRLLAVGSFGISAFSRPA